VNYPSIRIEGAILSPDIVERLDEAVGQKPSDFGFNGSVKVKDEIVRAWADAQDYWRIYQRKLETVKTESPATTETRQQWIVPFLGLLGYQLEYQPKAVELNGKLYAISHRVINRGNTPVHVIGCNEPAGLDKKPEKAVLRMSAHAMLQEYLNLKDELYGIVTNGRLLRLLRDSSRLVKLTYLEFDLDRIFADGLFADFAILYRLIHASRLPATPDTCEESLIERYHQDSLDSGARIRDGLSQAVEYAIRNFANGFLSHSDNNELREAVSLGRITPDSYYQYLLRLIYRILFLMVIEERDLIYPKNVNSSKRSIYDKYYSLKRLRNLSEKRYLADKRRYDLWRSLVSTFCLFEAEGPGDKLGISPLDGDLFDSEAIGIFDRCTLGNDVLLDCLRSLNLYSHPDTGQMIRVNYAALNVEEFGSVYEGLLEFKPVFETTGDKILFEFVKGDDRSTSGSHYTPDDLVQPLIKHSLDHLISDRLKDKNPERALLSLRVADISCGSGHILLAAARRIATHLATIRTGEEQPSPSAFRLAVRDVIRECIYGVDINPLAVDLCKVALWLEAHNPGLPLNFLDHHIKCGNAIVGYARREDVDKGVPDEAFNKQPDDDKDILATYRKKNKEERKASEQTKFEFSKEIQKQLDSILPQWRELSSLPEKTPKEIAEKKRRFQEYSQKKAPWLLSNIASIPITQFYLSKTPQNRSKIITNAEFMDYWSGHKHPTGQGIASAMTMALEKNIFHWFLEYPEIIERGGFDCILGNPPYLGRKNIRSRHGNEFCQYVQWEYSPAHISDVVVFFLQRIYTLLNSKGLAAIITTNSIKDGEVRRGGLDVVLAKGGEINFARRSIKWSGQASLFVSLLSIHKGPWNGIRVLDEIEVPYISSYFDDEVQDGEPYNLPENINKVFQGSIVLGDEFMISINELEQLINSDDRNKDVVFKLLNGKELNGDPLQEPTRGVINFFDWPLEKAEKFTEPFELLKGRAVELGKDLKSKKRNWWQFWRPRTELIKALKGLNGCFATAATTKYLNFSFSPTNIVFTNAIFIFATDRWDLFTIVQSTIHEIWARKYSGSLETRLRYSPSDCFGTFAFPKGIWKLSNQILEDLGKMYHYHRNDLMLSLGLGLTKTYNLFHEQSLTSDNIQEFSKEVIDNPESVYSKIKEMRNLHQKLDEELCKAYGWTDLNLEHGFYEVEILPENDRVRFTISPNAKKEVLKRLLKLNHELAKLDSKNSNSVKKKQSKKAKNKDANQQELL